MNCIYFSSQASTSNTVPTEIFVQILSHWVPEVNTNSPYLVYIKVLLKEVERLTFW